MDCIVVAETEGEEPVELPIEEDGTLLVTTLDAQFPGATGIKFINPKSGAARGVRIADGKFHPPGEHGWGDHTYFCVFPKAGDKRKPPAEEKKEEEPVAKSTKITPQCTDLIVLGLPWETTEATLKKYFEENYGGVVMAQVKIGRSGKSRGFGFVRFNDYSIQKKVMDSRHKIDGRWCDVSLPPNAKEKAGSPKIFVGRLPTLIEVKDLREYFEALGEVTDCFIPQPFRGFGFVTFQDPEVAKAACRAENHSICGATVHVESATPKPDPARSGPTRGDSRFKGNVRDRLGARGGGGYRDDDFYPKRGNRSGGGGGRSGNNTGRAGNTWGGYGRGDDDYIPPRGGGGSSRMSAGINLRDVSPSRLISAIKDAGLADTLGGLIGGGRSRGLPGNSNGYGSTGRGYSESRQSRFDTDDLNTPPAPSWSNSNNYDRYDYDY